ncbi:MAG: hypothetical protein ACRDLD_10440 [Thermoleophilaceae bacterium]
MVEALPEVVTGAESAASGAHDDDLHRRVQRRVVDRGRNSSGSGGTIVFGRSGRLSVIVATASSTSYSSVS